MDYVKTRKILFAQLPKNMVIVELGVLCGDFSQTILSSCSPSVLHLCDCWSWPESDDAVKYNWGTENQYNYVKKRFKNNTNVVIHKMTTTAFLKQLPDKYLDLGYIDADHSYESCKEDIENLYPKVRLNGYLTGHDYMGNVKKAVDEFCTDKKLKIAAVTYEQYPSFMIIKSH